MKTKFIRNGLLAPVLLVLLLFASPNVWNAAAAPNAATSTWNGSADTDWNNAANWTGTDGGSAPPAAGDEVVINSGGNQPEFSSGAGSAKRITINSGATLTMSGGTLTLTQDVIGDGNLTVSGGTINCRDFSVAGTTNMSNGLLALSRNFNAAPTNFAATGGTVQFSGDADGSAFAIKDTYEFYNILIDSGAAPEFNSADGNPGDRLANKIRVRGNWTNNSALDLGLTNTNVQFLGSGSRTIGGSQTTAFDKVSINKNTTVIIPSSGTIPTAATRWINNGTMQQTQNVLASSTHTFLQITDGSGTDQYRGLDITPTGNLGPTTVTIFSNSVCNNAPNGGEYRDRCFEAVSTNSGNATITLYTTTGEDDLADNDAFFQWNGGTGVWDQKSPCNDGVGAGGSCTGTATFASPAHFLIGAATNAPTAITLQGLSAVEESAFAPHGISLLWLAAAIVLGGAWAMRRRRAKSSQVNTRR